MENSRAYVTLRAQVAYLFLDMTRTRNTIADLQDDAFAADRAKAQLVVDVLRYTGVSVQ